MQKSPVTTPRKKNHRRCGACRLEDDSILPAMHAALFLFSQPAQPAMKFTLRLFAMMFLLFPASAQTAASSLTFTDAGNRTIILHAPPQAVVSLVPSITEILLRLGAADTVRGITYHSVLPPQTSSIPTVGGFFTPDLDQVAALKPDLIFYAGLQQGVRERFSDTTTLVELSPQTIAESFEQIRLLGRLFNRENRAEEIITRQQEQLQIIAKKTAAIPPEKRQRVMRLMGRKSIMTPGDDSFQHEFIRAAGGMPISLGANGTILPVSLEQWLTFNPQVLYGCGDDRSLLDVLHQPDWNTVDAVKNNRIYFFPCDLTCRAATHTGDFVSWLAARIYSREFSEPDSFVLPEQVIKTTPLELKLDYVRQAGIVESDIKDYRNKSVIVDFTRPMRVVSSLEGPRSGITTVANHYFPPPSWGLGHRQGLEALREETLQVLALPSQSTSILFTGANMDNLSVAREHFKEMEVAALVTAGVSSNSVRMGKDTGAFYEPAQTPTTTPGTINILLLTNMRLSQRAMTRALISATEAKSAALQDLDIRSSATPQTHQATGTGTDNILVVEGDGYPIDSSGGHTKMGELIARAVYAGVQEAVHLQNGLTAGRTIFQRLKERQISLHAVCSQVTSPQKTHQLRAQLERILLESSYADFLKAVLAISDEVERGTIKDMTSIDAWTETIAAELVGQPDVNLAPYTPEHIPRVLARGLAALLAGAEAQIGK